LFESRIAAFARSALQRRDGLGVPVMVVFLNAIVILAAEVEPRFAVRGEGACMATQRLLADHVEPDPADARRRAREVRFDERALRPSPPPMTRETAVLRG